MKVTFNIDYRTNWGESVYITGNLPVFGGNDLAKAHVMHFDGNGKWVLNLELDSMPECIEYAYIIKHENGSIRHEWGPKHLLKFTPGVNRCEVFDRWQDQPWDKPLYSSAIVDCINNRGKRALPVDPVSGMLTIRVAAPMIRQGEVLAICGDLKALGEWNPEHALRMSDANFPEWSANISLRDAQVPFDYKFLIINSVTGDVVAWEGRDNRRFDITPASNDESLVVAGMRFVNPLELWRAAGVAIPVFSLRSNDDFGVGDFLDLIPFIDWAASTGQKFVQILPINDTTMTHTWTDSYPYNANSTFALHPMYLRLEDMGVLRDEERMNHYRHLRNELNSLQEIDYERVNNAKREYTRELFAQDGAEVMARDDFKAFVKANKDWLTPYAAFCVLRDKYGTADMMAWDEYATYTPKKVERLVKQHPDDIKFVYFQQYFLDKQMRRVRDYAHSKGVAIKGDIPIGISRNSVDAWISPRLFNLDCQAGAPPDDFSVLGQNWGFPTYNWEEMNKDGFAWWKARFRKMAEYFDAYRIDHVLGFFRIWQIPMDAIHGLLGVFNPALPFSVDELRNSYDFWLDVDKQTTPYAMDWFLGDYFGQYTDEVRHRFLNSVGDGRYKLKDEFNTQRKVADYFATLEKTEANTQICNGLLGLIDNVLFVEDPYEKGKYHPRIAAQFTHIYRSLTDYEKWTFDRLYNDFYYRRHNDFWYGKAMWKLPALTDATNMLVCAEDLGMIPDCVPAVMSALEILSLEIQRMPKDPKAEFGVTWHYPYYSVCTTSTHDMGGIRQWWEEDREATQRYFNQILHEGGEAPYFAEPWVCEKILDQHLKSPSMLCILPLQDWMSMDGNVRRQDPREEQINVPANSRHYWRYRMHLTIEDLKNALDFNTKVRNLISWSGR